MTAFFAMFVRIDGECGAGAPGSKSQIQCADWGYAGLLKEPGGRKKQVHSGAVEKAPASEKTRDRQGFAVAKRTQSGC
jgi:hypothetical protein